MATTTEETKLSEWQAPAVAVSIVVMLVVLIGSIYLVHILKRRRGPMWAAKCPPLKIKEDEEDSMINDDDSGQEVGLSKADNTHNRSNVPKGATASGKSISGSKVMPGTDLKSSVPVASKLPKMGTALSISKATKSSAASTVLKDAKKGVTLVSKMGKSNAKMPLKKLPLKKP